MKTSKVVTVVYCHFYALIPLRVLRFTNMKFLTKDNGRFG